MIVLIDNYDSFTWNLYQMFCALGAKIQVVRNDRITIEELEALKPEALILSPGPGRPEDAGILVQAIDAFKYRIPILGVCLGHQAICQSEGVSIVHARKLMHGKADPARIQTENPLFAGIDSPMTVGRYHSLAADGASLPDSLNVIASARDGEIMGVVLTGFPVYGIQFHPESILTPQGAVLLKNFLNIVEDFNRD